MRLKARLGSYHFSCQFLNNPVAPEDADFQENWLNYFSVVDSRPESTLSSKAHMILAEVQ